MTLNLTQTDIITRLRRWAGVVGLASPNTSDAITIDATVANLVADPYQQEYDEFSFTLTVAAVAAVQSLAGLINGGAGGGCPLILVDRIEFFSNTSTAFTILSLRQQASTAGVAINGNTNAYNEGQPKGFPGAGRTTSRAAALNITTASPPGVFVASIQATAGTYNWVPPYPFQLYTSPGAPAAANQGDAIYVVPATVNVPITATIYWREWSSFRF